MTLLDDFENAPEIKAAYTFLQSLGAYLRIVLDTEDTFLAASHNMIPELDDWYSVTVRVKRIRGDAE